MNVLNGRERIMAVLEGRKTDHIPFAPLIGRYYVNSLPGMGIKLEDIASKDKVSYKALKENLNLFEIETIKYVGADVLYRHVNSYNIKYNDCIPIFKDEGDTWYEGYKTPFGTIQSEHKKTGGTEFISKYLIKNLEDIKIFTYVIEHAYVEPKYEDYLEFDEYIGEYGIATLSGPLTPIQQMLQFYMGVENTIYSLMDYEDEMEEMLDAMHNLNKKIYQVIADSPAKVVITYEDTSTTVFSPNMYEKYCAPILDEYSEILHSKGKIHIVHMCGKISLLTNQISKGKMDGIDSVCPPTTGDLEPKDALERIGKIIIGGLEPPALVRMSVDETRKYTIEKLRQVGSSKKFILCTGDSTAFGTPVENLREISKLVKEAKSPVW